MQEIRSLVPEWGILLSSESDSKSKVSHPPEEASQVEIFSIQIKENSKNNIKINNPILDPDGKEINKPACDRLAEEREHELGFVF